MAPRLQERFGVVGPMAVMLVLFAATLLAMGVWHETQWLVITAVIAAGAMLGNNNTLITAAVMNATDVERSTASAAYSFLRFIGGAIAPFAAGKLAEIYNPAIPFIVAAVCVFIAMLTMVFNYEHIKHIR
ncbi:MFS transporter [Lentibacillus lipolyticus]|nr:MFS transporter [Lentibacillus lipolyticus]